MSRQPRQPPKPKPIPQRERGAKLTAEIDILLGQIDDVLADLEKPQPLR